MTFKNHKATIVLGASMSLAALAIVAGCNGGSGAAATTGETNSASTEPNSALASLKGSIKIDGSSTVFPIAEAAAEEFGLQTNGGVQVTVGESGTGGGFKKFCAGETDISNASRPIKEEEIELCKANGIEYIEIPVGYDGLSVVVNPQNTWASDLTVEELKKIWNKDSKITSWKDVKAGFPDKPLKLYGPGTDSGTFDFFTKEINGEEGNSRADYQASEDDQSLVTGVAGDEGALGYFGFAYYKNNSDKLRVLKVNGIEPNHDTIKDGTYAPLARPEFMYVALKSADRPEVKAFIEFVMGDQGAGLVEQVGYVSLESGIRAKVLEHYAGKKTGTGTVDSILKAK